MRRLLLTLATFITVGFLVEPAAWAANAIPVYPVNQAARAAAVTASDSANLPGGVTLGIFNGNATACNIAMILQGDSTAVTWSNVQPGAILTVRAARIMSTNTTCTNIIAFYGP